MPLQCKNFIPVFHQNKKIKNKKDKEFLNIILVFKMGPSFIHDPLIILNDTDYKFSQIVDLLLYMDEINVGLLSEVSD